MKRQISKILFSAAAIMIAQSASAQLLKVQITDPSLQNQSSMTYSVDFDSDNDEYSEATADANGWYDVDFPMEEQFNWVAIEVKGSAYPAIVEKGKTLKVIVGDGVKWPKFRAEGDNAAASNCLKQLITSAMMPGAKFDNLLPAFNSSISKLADSPVKDFASRVANMFDTYEKLNKASGNDLQAIHHKIDNAEYNNLVGKINVNDPVYLRHHLNTLVIYNMMTKEDFGDGSDLTNYGIKFIEQIKKAGVTNKLVKHSLLDNIANLVLYQSKPKDAAPFWKALTDYAPDDQALIRKYKARAEEQSFM